MRFRPHTVLASVVLLAVAIWVPAPALAQSAAAEPAAGDAAAAGPTADADPPPDVQAQYRDVVGRAVVEFDAGRWAEARALFLRAHELWPSARTFRTLGMTSFELRAYAQALSELQTALSDPRRPLPEDQRAQVQALIDQTRAFVGRYRVQLSPAGAELRVDGMPARLDKDGTLALEIGRHELRARAAGYAEAMRRVDVQGREDEALALELQPEPSVVAAVQAPEAATPSTPPATTSDEHHAGNRLWTWVAAGTAVALAGTSTALWLVSDKAYDKEYDRCHEDGPTKPPTCSKDEADTSWQDLQTAHYVTLGFAIGAGAAAVALFFIEGGGDEEAPAVTIAPGGVYAHGRF